MIPTTLFPGKIHRKNQPNDIRLLFVDGQFPSSIVLISIAWAGVQTRGTIFQSPLDTPIYILTPDLIFGFGNTAHNRNKQSVLWIAAVEVFLFKNDMHARLMSSFIICSASVTFRPNRLMLLQRTISNFRLAASSRRRMNSVRPAIVDPLRKSK